MAGASFSQEEQKTSMSTPARVSSARCSSVCPCPETWTRAKPRGSAVVVGWNSGQRKKSTAPYHPIDPQNSHLIALSIRFRAHDLKTQEVLLQNHDFP